MARGAREAAPAGNRSGALLLVERHEQGSRRRARARVQGVAADALRRRMGGHRVAEGVRRPRRCRLAAADLQRGAVTLRRRGRGVRGRDRDGRADDHRVGHRRAAAALPRADAERRARVVPAVLRAGRGLRPRGPAHARGTRRRAVGRERAEGLDVGRAPQRLGSAARAHRPRRAEAQGHHRVPARHAHARRRGATAAPDQRDGALQRGVLHRRRDSRLVPARPGQRGLARREHDALERAGDDRRRRSRRLARHRRRSRSGSA